MTTDTGASVRAPSPAPRRAQVHRRRAGRDHRRSAGRRNRPHGAPERDPGDAAALRARAPAGEEPGFWLSHLLGGLHFLLGRRDRTPRSAPSRWRVGWRTYRGCSTTHGRTGRAGAGVRGNGAAHQRGRLTLCARSGPGWESAWRPPRMRRRRRWRVRARPGALARGRVRPVRAG